jgi:hypothetical protein
MFILARKVDPAFYQLNSTFQALFREMPDFVLSTQVEVIGTNVFDGLLRELSLFIDGQRQSEFLHYGLGHVLLNLEDVLHRARELFGPDVGVVARVDQLRRDP